MLVEQGSTASVITGGFSAEDAQELVSQLEVR
jgi:hypothetical protein